MPLHSILVAGHHDDTRDALTRGLAAHGFHVEAASTGPDALAIVQRGEVEIVLLDIEMPGGLEALQRIRRRFSLTELPVVIVTAHNQSAAIVSALKLGANDCLVKPIDLAVAAARLGIQFALKDAEAALRESEDRYALAARGANDGLWDWKLPGEVYFSDRWKSMLGLGDAEVAATLDAWLERIHPDDVERVRAAIDAHVGGDADHLEVEHRIRHRDGTYRWVLCRGLVVRDALGRAVRMAGSQTDITPLKLADPLTGLPNKLLLMDRLGRSIERLKRRPEYLFAVLVLDLDRFKLYNDSLGKGTGDQLLVAVGRRLEASLRSSDTVARLASGYTLARLGGDEFIILLDDLSEMMDSMRVAERIRESLKEPFVIDGQELVLSTSIGIAVGSPEHTGAEDLVRDAETAMHRAKAQGKARHELFDARMRVQALRRLSVENELRRAVDRGEFRVHYQPIVSLHTGRITGFEALVRWEAPEVGLLPPAEFIGIAEEIGLIGAIGRWVMREACRQARAWQEQFPLNPPLVISVNVSGREFREGGLADHVAAVIEETGLDPTCLKLEITESAILDDTPAVSAVLDRLRAMRVQLSLDDFGTGYSSLSYLHRYPFDTLKVDRAFITRLGPDGANGAIVHAILALGRSFDLEVIAEGIETAEQYAQLRSGGCGYGQGYFFSEPLDASAAEALLTARPCW